MIPPQLATPLSRRKKINNIIAVASGKGGVGKTWFSITLAHALSHAGLKILLFDGDLGLANIDVQLGLVTSYTLRDVLSGKVTLTQARHTYREGGFDIVSGQSGSGSVRDIHLSRLQSLTDDLAIMASDYDHVIIDLGAGIEQNTRLLAAQADLFLVLSTDEPTALTDAYTFVKLTRHERPDADVRLVINMINSMREGERVYNTLLKACEGFLKFSPPLAGIIRRDIKVRESIRSQTPLLVRAPNSEAANDVEALAFRLLRTPFGNSP